VVGRQPNISEFIARNYALVKADVQANPSGSNAFGLNMYQERVQSVVHTSSLMVMQLFLLLWFLPRLVVSLLSLLTLQISPSVV
jgi:hypothetical protein